MNRDEQQIALDALIRKMYQDAADKPLNIPTGLFEDATTQIDPKLMILAYRLRHSGD